MKIIAKGALATLVALGASQASAQKITFTLNWVAGGDHAPYFYAQKMGLYKQAGLDVDFETGRGSAASAQKVGAGQSQLGLSDMAGVLLFRGKGVDAVGVMNVYANSPQGLYWLKSSGIRSVNDLAGRKIGNPAGDGARTMWPALCAYDAAAFGAERSAVLAGLHGRLPAAELVAARANAIAGFLLGRDGGLAAHIGPLIADDDAIAGALVARALDGIEGPLFVDLADSKRELRRVLDARGFAAARPFTRMLYGSSARFDDAARTFAVVGPEFG